MQIRKTEIIPRWDSTPVVILIITLNQIIVFSVFLLKIMMLSSRWLLSTRLQNFHTILKNILKQINASSNDKSNQEYSTFFLILWKYLYIWRKPSLSISFPIKWFTWNPKSIFSGNEYFTFMISRYFILV